MDLTWELDLFQAADAPGVVELYREVYGDNYPVKAVYDPAEIIRQDVCGESWRAVARAGGNFLPGRRGWRQWIWRRGGGGGAVHRAEFPAGAATVAGHAG